MAIISHIDIRNEINIELKAYPNALIRKIYNKRAYIGNAL